MQRKRNNRRLSFHDAHMARVRSWGLAARKRALIEAFTGGDAGIEQSLGRMVAENPGVQQEISGEPTAMDFLRRAEAAPGGE